MNRHQDIAIVGGGISGLVAAFELSEDTTLNITIIEAGDVCGGKMQGSFNAEKQRFEEHSIRALSSTYFALFDIFSRAEILDTLTAVDDYIFYQSGSGRKVAVDRTEPLKFDTFRELVKTFDLSLANMMSLAKKIMHHVNASEEERQTLAYQKAGDVIGVEDFDEHTKQFIVNWFGILTGARMESKAVDIMDSFLLMFLPMTESPHLPPGKRSKSYCFNRPTSEVVSLLVDKLQKRGVKFLFNTRLTNVYRATDTNKVTLETVPHPLQPSEFDACIMAVPHEVMWKVGLIPHIKQPFNDEWSFGTQFLMDHIPDELKSFTGKSYNLSFDAPWNIVFQIQHGDGFWHGVEFPESHPYNLSATCSSPFKKGSLYGKRFMECTPTEAKHEILFQLGVTSEEERAHLSTHANIDSIYLKYTADWEQYAKLETASFGILQPNQKRWVDLSQIYVRSAEDEEIPVRSAQEGVFLAGEVVSVPGKWKIPTMEQAAMSGKQAAQEVFQLCQIDRVVNMEYATLENASGFRLMEGILAGLAGLAKIVPQRKNKDQ